MNFDGSESIPDLNKATFLAFDDKTVPIDDSWIAEWRYPSGVVTRRIANRQGHTNIIFKMKLDPVPAGDPCTVCWGTGKPFGSGQTPETINVVIENVEKGPGWIPDFGEPPNGAFRLSQIGGFPCRYVDADGIYNLIFTLGPDNASFSVFHIPGFVPSFDASGVECQTVFLNIITDEFVNGTATIFIPPIA